MYIDHIGYAVKDIAKSKSQLEELGFVFDDTVIDQKRNLKICFGVNNAIKIELLEAFNKNASSPIDLYLNNIGPTPYHFCYISDNIKEDINTLRKKNYFVILYPDDAVAFGGKEVAFLYEKNIGLIELVEK